MRNRIIDHFKSSAIISALIIGIIGSALWEKIFSPLSTFVFLHILSIFAALSENFSDNIYRAISRGFHEDSSELLLTLFIGLCIVALVSILIHGYFKMNPGIPYGDIFETNKETGEISYKDIPTLKCEIKKMNYISKKLFILTIILTFFNVVILLYFAGRFSFINTCITETTNNIEILSPYISDHDYKILKSKFHLIKSKSDYDALNAEIEVLLNTYSILSE